jgi:soluble lytic murein transglycosylase
MKTKHLKIGIALTTATLSMALFNNFSFITFQVQSALEHVQEAARVSHAKELLGKTYKGSDAQKIEGQTALNEMIQRKIAMSMAPKYKAQSRAIARTIINESAKYKLDPVFVLAIIATESKFNPEAIGSVGEIGLMQIRPETAKWMAAKMGMKWQGKESLKNPNTNIKISLAYMNYLRTKFISKPTRYVSAYNMGPLNVRRLIAKNVTPAEYNARVMKNYKALYANIADKKPRVVAVNTL